MACTRRQQHDQEARLQGQGIPLSPVSSPGLLGESGCESALHGVHDIRHLIRLLAHVHREQGQE